METIEINQDLSIPLDELTFSAVRSSGPGGQNVNKVSTRVSLEFDVDKSPSLNEEQKNLIKKRLKGRISGEGIFRVSSQKSRQQSTNREDALRRFAGLLAGALQERKVRRKTGVPKASKQERLEEKKKRGFIKQSRKDGRFPGF
jgi:ribosome-associated protein